MPVVQHESPATAAARGLEPDNDSMMSSGPVSWDSDCPSELSGSGSASGCDSDHDASSHSLPSSLDDAVVSAGSTESTGLAFLHTQSTLSVTHKDVHAFAAQLPPGSVIAHRFEVLERIGEGSFGAAYRALDIAHGRMLVALKVARSRAVQDERASCNYTFDEFLGVEVASYTRIGAVGSASSISTSGIPCVYAYGKHIFAPAADTEAPWVVISFMAMQLLGQSVWRCMREQRLFVHDSGSEDDPIDDGSSQASGSGKQWQPSRAWVVKTGKGMLKALAACHAAGCVHRDVKTENFCVDTSNDNSKIFVCDFGFARHAYGHYAPALMNTPVASFWGTPDYASLSALRRLPQTPRDDLEALGYCLLELEQPDGRLPWHGRLTNDREAQLGWSNTRLSEMADAKGRCWAAVCKQGLVPGYLQAWHAYITSLGVCDVPDYGWLETLLDSGETGLQPSSAPRSLRLRSIPPSGRGPAGVCDGDAAWVRHAVLQVSMAASAILSAQQRLLQLAGGSNDARCHRPSAAPHAAAASLPSFETQAQAARTPATQQQGANDDRRAGSSQQRATKRCRHWAEPAWASADGGKQTGTTAAAGSADGSAAAVDEHALHDGSPAVVGCDALERKLLNPIMAGGGGGGPLARQQHHHQVSAEAEPLMAWPELDGSQEFY